MKSGESEGKGETEERRQSSICCPELLVRDQKDSQYDQKPRWVLVFTNDRRSTNGAHSAAVANHEDESDFEGTSSARQSLV